MLVKYAEPNEVAAFAKPLYKIGSLKDVRLRAYFSAADVTKLKIGQKLSVAADFGAGETRRYDGVLVWVSPQSEYTPKGIRTRDERADRLSGGQKQRIAFARVFLKNPPFIAIDEATAVLDVNSEAFIQKSVDSLMCDRTMLIIAHRFSTIRNVRMIIVFKDGAIADYGTHAKLIDRCPEYRRLYEKQSTK